MSPTSDWKLGDRVVHATRPEWGVGEIRGAEPTVVDGAPCQRVTVRFDRAGVKVLATSHALLVPAPAAGLPASNGAITSPHDIEIAPELEETIVQIPEPATDPFRTPRDRLAATLALYRYTGTAGSLLDWAAAQSGLKDPLAKFNRHELESLFQRFRANLDAHLKKLMQELRREDPAQIRAVVAAAPPAGQQAVKRIDFSR